MRFLLASRSTQNYDLSVFARRNISQDASLVLEACEELQKTRAQYRDFIHYEIICTKANKLVHDYVDSLDDKTLHKLALIIWHFDAGVHIDTSSSEAYSELAYFLEHPTNDAIWKAIHTRYYNGTPLESLHDFKASYDFLLSLLLR